MSLTPFQDNVAVNAPKVLDARSMNLDGTPYTSVSEANAVLISSRRSRGLVVNIDNGTGLVQYRYKAGVTDGDLVKIIDLSAIPASRIFQFSYDMAVGNNSDNDFYRLYDSMRDIE